MDQEWNSRRPRDSVSLHDQVEQLTALLKHERTRNRWQYNARLELSKDLNETKQQLARQKSLKEMFIKRGKDTRNELERLKRLSDPETMDTMRIATEVRNTIKLKRKKVLQQAFEDLKVAYIISQEKFSAELQVEKTKNGALQQELEQLRASHQINPSFKTELKGEKEKGDIHQKHLEKEIHSQAENVSEYLEALKQQMVENDALVHQMEEEIQTLKKDASEQEMFFKKQEDVMSVKDALVHQMEEEIQNLKKDASETEKSFVKELEDLKSVKDTLVHQMEEEIQTLKENASEAEKSFVKELEDLKEEQSSTKQDLINKLQTEREINQTFQNELSKLEKEKDKTRQRNQASHHHVLDVELLEEIGHSEEQLEEKKKKPSAWKRFRHHIGLRKMKKKEEKRSSI